jgi:hypothetical protein
MDILPGDLIDVLAIVWIEWVMLRPGELVGLWQLADRHR